MRLKKIKEVFKRYSEIGHDNDKVVIQLNDENEERQEIPVYLVRPNRDRKTMQIIPDGKLTLYEKDRDKPIRAVVKEESEEGDKKGKKKISFLCPKCGFLLRKTDNFCSKCGRRVLID